MAQPSMYAYNCTTIYMLVQMHSYSTYTYAHVHTGSLVACTLTARDKSNLDCPCYPVRNLGACLDINLQCQSLPLTGE